MPLLHSTTEAIQRARLAYPPAEVADLLGLSRARVYELLADGTIPSVKIGRSRRVRHQALVDFLADLEHQEVA